MAQGLITNTKQRKKQNHETANTLGNVTTLVKELSNGTNVHATVAKPSFSTADLWSIQRNRRVRSVRKVIFN